MGGQLFPSLLNTFKESYPSAIFSAFNNGYLLPVATIKEGDSYSYGSVFIDSMITGQFIINSAGSIIAYYFHSAFKIINHGSFIISYMQTKAGHAKECKRVYADDSVVILDFVDCGMAVISPEVNSQILSILEEQ